MKVARFSKIVLVVPFLLVVSSPFSVSAQEEASTLPKPTTALAAATPSLRGSTDGKEKDVGSSSITTNTKKQEDNISETGDSTTPTMSTGGGSRHRYHHPRP